MLRVIRLRQGKEPYNETVTQYSYNSLIPSISIAGVEEKKKGKF